MPLLPHWGQSQVAGASGFLVPHSGQNLAVMPLLPQLGQSQAAGASGFLQPHSPQNLPVMPLLPQLGQSHVSAALGSGFFAPHSGQNLLWIFLAPHWQSHPPDTGTAGWLFWGFMPCIMELIWGIMVFMAAIPTPKLIMSPMIPPLPPPPILTPPPILPMPSAKAFCTSAWSTSFWL